MAWQIAYFYSDQTVSMISEKWPKKNGKKSYFPKTKVAKNIRKEANVDKKSDRWGLYACRILMNGGMKADVLLLITFYFSNYLFYQPNFTRTRKQEMPKQLLRLR